MKVATLLSLLPCCVVAHGDDFPVNPALGVPGFPDCKRANPELDLDVEGAALDLVCSQKEAPKEAIKIACIGDSITAGVRSSGGNHPYPQQLQLLLDKAYGEGKYSVTNLGACGSTMLKKSNSPYWERGQFSALQKGKWDIVTIMLGTNDAKDPGSSGPDNWQHDCSGADGATTEGCSYAQDYKDMVDLVRTLGTTDGVAPDIYAMIPAPLMAHNSIGANQTVINSVYPQLLPLIARENGLKGTIDVFSGMGGVPNWEEAFPTKCVLNSTWAPCAWWCDEQSCNQCHPNDDGYAHLATVVQAGLGLTGPTVV